MGVGKGGARGVEGWRIGDVKKVKKNVSKYLLGWRKKRSFVVLIHRNALSKLSLPSFSAASVNQIPLRRIVNVREDRLRIPSSNTVKTPYLIRTFLITFVTMYDRLLKANRASNRIIP